MKRRLPPKPEQPEEGYVFNPAEWIFGPRRYIHRIELENLCAEAMRNYDSDARSNPYIVASMGISALHKYAMLPWNQDPSYNWRRKNVKSR